MKQTTYWHTLQVIILLLQSPCTHASQPTFTQEEIQKIFFSRMSDWANPNEQYPSLETVKPWIDKGADVNGIKDPNKEGKDQPTPLIFAIQLFNTNKTNFELINLLLDKGAEISKTGKIGGQTLTPLQAAVRFGKAKVVEFLLDKGVSTKEIRDADIKALNNAPKVNADNKKATLDMLNSKNIQLKTNSIQGTKIRAYKKDFKSLKTKWCVKVEVNSNLVSEISFKKNTDNMVKTLKLAPGVTNKISVYTTGSCTGDADFSQDLVVDADLTNKQLELGTESGTIKIVKNEDVQEPKERQKIRAYKTTNLTSPWCVTVVDDKDNIISEPVTFKANTDYMVKSVYLQPGSINKVRVYKSPSCSSGEYSESDDPSLDLTRITKIPSDQQLAINEDGKAKLVTP